MPFCFLCMVNLPSISLLCKHFKIKHTTHDFSSYICAEVGCSRSFYLINSFKKHLATHTLNESTPIQKIGSTHVTVNSLSTEHTNVNTVSTNDLDTFPSTSYISESGFSNYSAENSIKKSIASLYANPQIPRNVVQTVIGDMADIFHSLHQTLKNSTNKLLLDSKISNESFDHFNNILDVIEHPFIDLSTEYKRIKYFTELGTYIEPCEYIVGERLNETRKNNSFYLVPVHCTEQFIPIRSVLKNFFQMKNVLSDTLEYMNKCKHSKKILLNFVQGSVWKDKEKYHESQTVLPIVLFFDDYEIGNPLGSHSGIHKLGAVYISIPCIPPHRQSSLNTIFLALLFHSSDRQKFGNNVIFKPLIDELNYLRHTGIDIDIDGFKGIIKFELGVIIGDNLGVHSITGFVESFSSNYPCRICNIRKEEMKKQCYADDNLLRTVDQYNFDVNEGDVSNSGIKEKCVWHDILGFNVLNQVGMDVMHDILEGVGKYDLAFLIYYYVHELKLFSLQILNERIVCFNYGPDKGSKPSVLDIDHIRKNTIRLSASEMISLIRYFGLLIGDFIPRSDPIWYIYTLLRKIIDLITSTTLQEECCELIQTLVSEHNDLYIKYSKQHLRPKYHFLLHYHTMIKKFGPLINLWCMRFEAKHRISKISANTSSNRRNICKTLAIKQQLQLNNLFIEGSLGNEIESSPSKDLINDADVQDIKKFMEKDSLDLVICCKWVSIKGTKYQIKMVLTLDVNENSLPKFGIIDNIYLYNNKVIMFKCLQLNTIIFDDHFCSYEVTLENNVIFLYHHMLYSHIPNNICVLPNGCTYVTLRSSI